MAPFTFHHILVWLTYLQKCNLKTGFRYPRNSNWVPCS